MVIIKDNCFSFEILACNLLTHWDFGFVFGELELLARSVISFFCKQLCNM